MLFEHKSNKLIFNHVIYDQTDDEYFAKHSHNLCELIFVLRGKVNYVIENHKYTAQANDLILIKTLSYHYFKIDTGEDYEKISLLFPYDDNSFIPEQNGVLHCNDTLVQKIFQDVIYYYKNFSLERVKVLLKAFIKEIMWNVEFLVETHTSEPQLISPVISNSVQYINDHLFTIQKLDEICAHLNLSPQHFKQCFKKELHITPHQYILEKRLLHAKNILLMGGQPTKIYFECGFNSFPAFYQAFVKFFKRSPLDMYNEFNGKK